MAGNCIICSKKLRVDSSHRPHCSRCWLKFTVEGRAFNTAKTKSFYVPKDLSQKPRCLACNKTINTFKNGGYCRICWEGTEEGKRYRAEKVKRSQAKKTLN